MGKKCEITGKTFNNGYSVSHSHKRSKKRQLANLQNKKIWVPKLNRWVRMNISTKALKSLNNIEYFKV